MRVNMTVLPGANRENVVAQLGGTVVYAPSSKGMEHIIVARLPGPDTTAAQAHGLVIDATKDGEIKTNEIGIAAIFAKDYAANWGINRVNGPAAHAVNKGEGVNLAVLDTGKVDHPDLIEVAHFNAITPGDESLDGHGHSHHVCGIAAAQINDFGVVGAAPGVRLHTVRTMTDAGSGPWSAVLIALDWCANNGIKVTSNSYGGGYPGQAVEDAFQVTADAGMIHCCSAGNSNGGAIGYPAALASCHAVTSSDKGDASSSFSSIGDKAFVVAPGRDIFSTYKGNQYASFSGTSMSCPLFAGIICLMLSSGITDPIAEVPQIVDDLGSPGRDPIFGYGLPMADRAVQAPVNPVFGWDIVIDASKSFDPDGTIESYWFDTGDLNSWHRQATPIYEYSYTADGIFNVVVTVRDNDLVLSPEWEQTIEIKKKDGGGEENIPPTTLAEIRDQTV